MATMSVGENICRGVNKHMPKCLQRDHQQQFNEKKQTPNLCPMQVSSLHYQIEVQATRLLSL